VVAGFTQYPLTSVIGGEQTTVKLLLTNTSGLYFSGPLTIDVFASATSAISSASTQVASLSLANLDLGVQASNASKTEKLHFTWPSSLTNGSYYLIGVVTATVTGTAPSEPVTPVAIAYFQPTVDLTTTFGSAASVTVVPGIGANALVTIRNVGNVVANGTLDLTLYASLAPNLDTSVDEQLASLQNRKISLHPGHSRTFRVHFTAPADEAGGNYYLIASMTSSTTVANSNSANDVAVINTVDGSPGSLEF
jgi:hypothetical protein